MPETSIGPTDHAQRAALIHENSAIVVVSLLSLRVAMTFLINNILATRRKAIKNSVLGSLSVLRDCHSRYYSIFALMVYQAPEGAFANQVTPSCTIDNRKVNRPFSGGATSLASSLAD